MFATRLVQLTCVVVAMAVGFLYYDDVSPDRIETEFSSNLRAWFARGKYMTYKNSYRIFYVAEHLVKSSGGANVHHNEEDGNDDISEGNVVLFLHGFPTSSFDFAPVWKQFVQSLGGDDSSRARINASVLVTFDYIGYGFSDKPFDYEYSIFDMADMVDKLLVHLNVRRVTLVAHDIGDTVALELLRRQNLVSPSSDAQFNTNHFHIDKCVLLNGGIVHALHRPMWFQQMLLTKYARHLAANGFFKFISFRRGFLSVFGSLHQPNAVDLYDFYLTIRYKEGNRVLPLTIGYIEERQQYGDVWLDALNDTHVPVTFIYGPADPINPRDKFISKVRTDLPRLKLHVLNDLVSHYPHWEDAFTVFELIRTFIGEGTAATTTFVA